MPIRKRIGWEKLVAHDKRSERRATPVAFAPAETRTFRSEEHRAGKVIERGGGATHVFMIFCRRDRTRKGECTRDELLQLCRYLARQRDRFTQLSAETLLQRSIRAFAS